MPTLIEEIEQVIFEAHPSLEREGAFDFGELLTAGREAIAIRDLWKKRPWRT